MKAGRSWHSASLKPGRARGTRSVQPPVARFPPPYGEGAPSALCAPLAHTWALHAWPLCTSGRSGASLVHKEPYVPAALPREGWRCPRAQVRPRADGEPGGGLLASQSMQSRGQGQGEAEGRA